MSSISNGWDFWSLNHTLIDENSELNVFRTLKFASKISNNYPNDLFGMTAHKTLESSWSAF